LDPVVTGERYDISQTVIHVLMFSLNRHCDINVLCTLQLHLNGNDFHACMLMDDVLRDIIYRDGPSDFVAVEYLNLL
jgi:hypothetical protein